MHFRIYHAKLVKYEIIIPHSVLRIWLNESIRLKCLPYFLTTSIFHETFGHILILDLVSSAIINPS